MTSEDITGRGTGAQSSWTDMSYTAGNQTSYWNGQEIEFDLDGNMTWGPLSDAFAAYEYNTLNQLVQTGSTAYGYDGEGRRVWQKDGSGSELRYITDPNAALSQLLVMQNSDGSSTYYVYGNGLIAQEHFTADGDAEYRVFHYDYRGSTVAMTDQQGAVTDRITYNPYGKITSRTGSTKTIFLYVGQWGVQTDGSGLLYMRARYYSTDLNRFINEDPIKDSINWYAYANNNPITMIDADGLRANPKGSALKGLGSAEQAASVIARTEELNSRPLGAGRETSSIMKDRRESKDGSTSNKGGASAGSSGSTSNTRTQLGARTYSDELVQYVKSKEALRQMPYNSGQTVGYGFDYYMYPEVKINWNDDGSISEAEADRLLRIILDQSQDQINDYFDEEGLLVDQNTFDALTDLFYSRNSCPETMEIALAMAMKDDEKVLELFEDFDYRYAYKYRYNQNSTEAQAYVDRNPGLITRREEEYTIYKNGF